MVLAVLAVAVGPWGLARARHRRTAGHGVISSRGISGCVVLGGGVRGRRLVEIPLAAGDNPHRLRGEASLHRPVRRQPPGGILAAWQAISHAGATKDRWAGEKPYSDWDWSEDPEDLTAEDRYAKEEA